MQRLTGLIAALAVAFFSIAGALADDAAGLRQELDTLRSKIEQIDAEIADTARGNEAIKANADAYAAKMKTNAASDEALKQRGQQLASRKEQLDTERAATEQACHKTTATPQEYQVALAHCEKASQTYQQNVDAYRAEQQRFAADYGAYTAAAKDLQAQYKDIEQKRQDLSARQTALRDTRQGVLDRFNEVRDRVTALQSSPSSLINPNPSANPR